MSLLKHTCIPTWHHSYLRIEDQLKRVLILIIFPIIQGCSIYNPGISTPVVIERKGGKTN